MARSAGYQTGLTALSIHADLEYTRLMDNDFTNFTYTSPTTGVTYEVRPHLQTRMAGGMLEGCPMYLQEYIQYDIYRDNFWVQFSLDKDTISESVDVIERPERYAEIGSRFD